MAKVCSVPNCPNIARFGDKGTVTRCEDHWNELVGHRANRRPKQAKPKEYTEQQRKYDKARGNRHERGYDNKWDQARKGYLLKHPWCVKCKEQDKRVKAVAVDHIIPHERDMRKFWDKTNWQGLCQAHHNRKTGAERRAKAIPPV